MIESEHYEQRKERYAGTSFCREYLEPDVKSVEVKTGRVMCISDTLYGGFTNEEQEGN